MTKLTAAALAGLADRVSTPTYPRTVPTGIVHFGVGGFHRAHEAMYIDRILEAGDRTWGICGVGVLEADRGMRDVFAAQDNLYTLVTVAPHGLSTARVIGSITEYLFAPDDPGTVVRKLADPETRIVSLTITEGGYSIDDGTGRFDPRDAATLADLTGHHPPRSVLGLITAGLSRRRDAGVAPFTVMSCDNIQGNGDVARTALVGFAQRVDPELAQWIADTIAFPNSMVDRITPVTTDQTRESIASEYGVEDAWPVRSESFEQWVIEDRFTLGRPPLETVGVQVVADVEPYELMKLRLLNASHQAMSYLGILSGAEYVHEVCADPLFTAFLLSYMHEEAIPTLSPVPGIDLSDYCDQLLARFASEATRDTLARQVVDGSARIPKFLLPVVRAQLQLKGEANIARCTLVLAAWSIFIETFAEASGGPAVDAQLADLVEAVARERSAPGAFLDLASVFGDLGAQYDVRDLFVRSRAALVEYGIREAIRRVNLGIAL